VAVVQENGTYILGTNPDPVLLAVDKALMDHRMVLHKSDLPGRWATPPPTQAIATGSDVLIAEELGAMRRAQEQTVADKKKTPKKRWGVEQVSKLLRLTRVPSESELPPIYTAPTVGKGVAQDRIILQNAFVARCLEAGAATTTAPIVTPTFARDIGALVFAGVSIECYGQGASIFNAACGGAGKLAAEQLNAARVWDLGASASAMSVADLQAAADRLKIVLPTSLLSFILVLRPIVLVWTCYWGFTTTRHSHSGLMSQGCQTWSPFYSKNRCENRFCVYISCEKFRCLTLSGYSNKRTQMS
jgi:hypothetical protein